MRVIVARDLLRSVRSVKGIILGILTLIGAFITAMICTWLEGQNRAKVGAGSTQAYIDLKRSAIEKATGDASLASYIASVPYSLLLFLKVTIWLGPLLIALLGFDGVASDLQHRSVRFWTLRARRWSFLVGKFFALWALVALITLVLNVL